MSRKLEILSFFSFAYGGFLIVLYLVQLYLLFWRSEVFQFGTGGGLSGEPFGRLVVYNSSAPIRTLVSPPHISPLAEALSPFSIMLVLTGIAFVINGYVLWRFLHQSAKTGARNDTLAKLLTGDEKIIFEKLSAAGGSLTQKELCNATGFSPVKTHRVVHRLKLRGAVEVHPFGMTNKVVLA